MLPTLHQLEADFTYQLFTLQSLLVTIAPCTQVTLFIDEQYLVLQLAGVT